MEVPDGGSGLSRTTEIILAALGGGTLHKLIDSALRWRGEQVHIHGDEIDVDIKASTQWRELYNEEMVKRRSAEEQLGLRIDKLEGEVDGLNKEKAECQREIDKLMARVRALEME